MAHVQVLCEGVAESGGQGSGVVLADSDAAVERLTEAVDATPPGDPLQAGRLSLLGDTLRVRFDRTQALADVDEAVRAGRRAVDSTPDGDPHRAERLSNLGSGPDSRAPAIQRIWTPRSNGSPRRCPARK